MRVLAALVLVTLSLAPSTTLTPFAAAAVSADPSRALRPEGAASFVPDAVVRLEARPGAVPLLPGPATEVLRYHAVLESGPPGLIDSIPGSYLGPIFHVRTGDRLRVHFANRTGEPSIVHWHGLILPDSADGHPRLAVPDGEVYTYDFQVVNRAGTYWYHPHPHMATGPQVVKGLAGLFLVSDPEEDSLPLPRGEYDVPVVIQDRTFDDRNQIQFDHDFMEGGSWGERILVNGTVEAEFSAATRAYRFRILNGSASRTYKLAWSDGTPITVIGTDGGLLRAPATRPYLMLTPGERADLWMDLSAYAVGSEVTLRSLAYDPGGMEIMAEVPPGAPLDLWRIQVDRSEPETLLFPTHLTVYERLKDEVGGAVNSMPRRVFAAARLMEQWVLNGRPFQMEEVASNEIVRAGELEQWELTNNTGEYAEQMPHPIHLHGVQFQVIERSVNAAGAAAWETVRDGFVDSGWKDTFLLPAGGTVRFLVRFGPYEGLYLYHCHNLVHEDMGMMRNYRVVASAAAGPAEAISDVDLEMPAVWSAPNPLEIRLALPSGVSVGALEVLDSTGRQIGRWEVSARSEETTIAHWDLRGTGGVPVPRGVYFIRLQTPTASVTRKLVLLAN